VLFVEAFVNDGTPFSPFALTALDSLAALFPREQVIIVEYHLPSANFADAHALPESAGRYSSLVATDQGVPDVFFNGSLIRMQGASSSRTALLRYRSAAQSELGKISHFTIEARKNLSSSRIEIEVTVARLGDADFAQFAVLAIVWEDLGTAGHHHVARKIFPPENFNSIEAGARKTAQFAASLSGVTTPERLQVAVLIEQASSLGREVLQATLAE
jgi:hypothetical protein